MKMLGERSRSAWMGTSVLKDAAALEKDEAADVVIVGSGIAGISIAMNCKQLGWMWSLSTDFQSRSYDLEVKGCGEP